jgi:hypothetical protein
MMKIRSFLSACFFACRINESIKTVNLISFALIQLLLFVTQSPKQTINQPVRAAIDLFAIIERGLIVAVTQTRIFILCVIRLLVY